MARLAVVLFNFGGPDRPESVRPFLFNLFNDRYVIDAPWPIRWILAHLISWRRAPVARKIYDHMGGKSPLLELTKMQGEALKDVLAASGDEVEVFIAMQYWHPMSYETALMVKNFMPDEIVLLPLYPQYSTTTTESSLMEWRHAAKSAKITALTRAVCCYPAQRGWIEAQVELIEKALSEMKDKGKCRLLFSAHGLPKKIISKGDPYQWQVERTAEAIVTALNAKGLDWAVCYQSRVGPMEWIGPSMESELARAGRESVSIIVAPITFVSEHSETLVELDVEYRELAKKEGVPAYFRVPAVGDHQSFILGLAELVEKVRQKGDAIASDDGARICPESFCRCIMKG